MARKNYNWSWVLHKLLDLRPQLQRFRNSQIGDGHDSNAWEDNWLSCGHLSSFIFYRFVHSSGFSTNTTVREYIQRLDGVWPTDWCLSYAVLANSPLPSLHELVRDRVLLVDNHNSGVEFTFSTTWSSLDGSHPIVPWYSSVWFPGHIPKHAFCLWLACHHRLPSQDRMLWKHEPPDLECSLCKNCMDNHIYIFF
ncbi:uncharacterized protein LOC112514101 [Cynara cardunculus var. scolymus]|uniref:uncharacterized protein LOC112514101 n=1 Tax=Cynara cardunculus var. scolymus TaxID=59895 RepID=UPI000D62E684|nr:uncharacterized protein LOC112514101 [Cynara cardunculus var. scolymus]